MQTCTLKNIEFVDELKDLMALKGNFYTQHINLDAINFYIVHLACTYQDEQICNLDDFIHVLGAELGNATLKYQVEVALLIMETGLCSESIITSSTHINVIIEILNRKFNTDAVVGILQALQSNILKNNKTLSNYLNQYIENLYRLLRQEKTNKEKFFHVTNKNPIGKENTSAMPKNNEQYEVKNNFSNSIFNRINNTPEEKNTAKNTPQMKIGNYDDIGKQY